jgi:hypothetical protein
MRPTQPELHHRSGMRGPLRGRCDPTGMTESDVDICPTPRDLPAYLPSRSLPSAATIKRLAKSSTRIMGGIIIALVGPPLFAL